MKRLQYNILHERTNKKYTKLMHQFNLDLFFMEVRLSVE